MKIIAAIQARMGSTRFPGKVMKDLCDKPVLQWVIEQAKQMNVDGIICLMPESEKNIPIGKLCGRLGIESMHKSIFINDKFNRNKFVDLECFYWYHQMAILSKADYIIRICGDSPFIDYKLANRLIEQIDGMDYYSYAVYNQKMMPAIFTKYGIFCEIIAVKQLKAIMEHVTPFFYKEYRNIFVPIDIPYDYKLSIDYPEDLEKAKKVIQYNAGKIPNKDEIDNIMLEHPELQYKEGMEQSYEWNDVSKDKK